VSDCPDLPEWLPDPPMGLWPEWSDWRDTALDWIAEQDQPWTADDMRDALPPARPNWYGATVRTASGRDMIRLVGQRRSTHPTRKKSLLAIWQTTHTPKETP
jgi:hypothetical protein